MRGLCFPGKRSKVQECILWRRVAGGLSAERQEKLLAGEQASIRAGKAPPELVRLAGSLERLSRETKADLIQTFIAQVLHRVELKQHCAPYLAALGLSAEPGAALCGAGDGCRRGIRRARLRGICRCSIGPSPSCWRSTLFSCGRRASWTTATWMFPKSLRNQIARKLEGAGIAPIRTATIKAFTPAGRTDSTALYGEPLPPGLMLGANLD